MEQDYIIEVKTGGYLFSGTDANVYISLFGKHNSVKDIPLKSEENDLFENTKVDTFKMKLPSLGYIQKITLRHDNTGIAPGWFVNQVTVKNVQDETSALFVFKEWFTRKSGLEHSQENQGFPIEDIIPGDDYKSIHKTEKFQEDPSNFLILRRGLSVRLRLVLSRPYISNFDDFDIILRTGKNPKESTKSHVVISRIVNPGNTQVWGYRIVEATGNEVTVEIDIPCKALVARYDLSIEKNDEVIYRKDGKVVILFNPWCQDDEVYMESEGDLREYILKQHGYVYQGTWRRPYPKKWYFGQFEAVSLDTVFHLLEDVNIRKRDTAVEISRIISSKCNSFDNNGVLMGNWSGDYSGGKSPSFWSTTPSLLENYRDNGYKPVRYGQCWVFSAVVTTMMRAIGVPTRSITNFSSAHDTDANCANDVYFKENNEVDDEASGDSVWNFHVWNDAWMRRNDLNDEMFHGWQAIDATPQERSDGMYSGVNLPNGSLSLASKGCIDVQYDTKFVFAEVNADTVYWMKKEGKFEPVRHVSSRVGRSISTKAVNSESRHDITDEYKHLDSLLDKAASRKALKLAGHPIIDNFKDTIYVEVVGSKENYYAGQLVDVNLKVRNKAAHDQSIVIDLIAKLVRYDGNPIAYLNINDSNKRNIKLKAESDSSTTFSIPAGSYLSYLQGNDSIRLYASVHIPETDEYYMADETVELLTPELEFSNIPDHIKPGMETITFTVSFKNPLEIPLEKCEASIGGVLLPKAYYDFEISDIPANGRFEKTYTVDIKDVSSESGKKKFIYTFGCKQLGGFNEMFYVKIVG